MPLYLKPGMRARIYLRSDENDDPRPEFFTRALTLDEQIELSNVIDEMHAPAAIASKTTEQLCNEAVELLSKYVDGWENLPDGFTLRKLSYHEIRQLLTRVLFGQGMEFEEKKD